MIPSISIRPNFDQLKWLRVALNHALGCTSHYLTQFNLLMWDLPFLSFYSSCCWICFACQHNSLKISLETFFGSFAKVRPKRNFFHSTHKFQNQPSHFWINFCLFQRIDIKKCSSAVFLTKFYAQLTEPCYYVLLMPKLCGNCLFPFNLQISYY